MFSFLWATVSLLIHTCYFYIYLASWGYSYFCIDFGKPETWEEILLKQLESTELPLPGYLSDVCCQCAMSLYFCAFAYSQISHRPRMMKACALLYCSHISLLPQHSDCGQVSDFRQSFWLPLLFYTFFPQIQFSSLEKYLPIFIFTFKIVTTN